MEDNRLRYTLRINKDLFEKFKYVAGANGRSANKEIEQFIKKHVAQYEEKFGKIDLDD
ncbi:MAG: Arc family DNA-binding protein [Clostridiales bacterium]|nr:Arc family DNA-binding protein [Clostridiales bacterium]